MTTEGLAPDVAIAVELLERIDLEDWPRRTEGLTHPHPYLRLSDGDFWEELQAWLASRAGDQPSFIQASVANFRCVLDDLLLVIHYDMILRGDVLWVRKWYHGAFGGTSDPREAEFFQIHTLLIQNLAAELTRAVNLVLVRTRRADDRVLQLAGLALVNTGSNHRPMHPAEYTASEQKLPQPYPGLHGFPRLITSRDVGALGEVHLGLPRVPADFELWMVEMLKRTGELPSDPPGSEIPPRALPRPELRAPSGHDPKVRQDDGHGPSSFTHPALLAIAGIVFAALGLPAVRIGLGLAILVLVWRRIARAPRRDALQALAIICAVVFLVLWIVGTDERAGDRGRANKAPSALPPRHEASPGKVIVVDNRVTSGMRMREDEDPARLTAKPAPDCESRGCDIPNTERESGQSFNAAVCQRRGEEITNGDNSSSADDDNPRLVTSTRYYGVHLKASDTFGYINEVWIVRRDRGGLGLPTC